MLKACLTSSSSFGLDSSGGCGGGGFSVCCCWFVVVFVACFCFLLMEMFCT